MPPRDRQSAQHELASDALTMQLPTQPPLHALTAQACVVFGLN
jgi:hypothetical protein